MRLPEGARVAVVGAGPGGLVAAKHALQAGFEVHVFEASDDLGGQWHTRARHSGVWPGMRTNTSRMMTAFSDFPPPGDHELYPFAEQVHRYLRAYAAAFGVSNLIEFETPVTALHPGWLVNGQHFDAVIVASGRFRAPQFPGGMSAFAGEMLHAFDYPGADVFRGRRVLVYGNGVSGHEIASDLGAVTDVVSAYRKPRYVLQKVVDGIPSDWRWYTQFAALQRQRLPADVWSRLLRERVERVHGNPVDFGAPRPDDDILVAGHSLCQNYLEQVREGQITCRPGIAAIDGQTVTFTDGTQENVDAVVCATGYAVDIPYLDDDIWSRLGRELRLHLRTFHPDLPGLAFVGQFALQGPYLPLLELQARWIAGVWSAMSTAPRESAMRANVDVPPPATDAHNVLALALSEAAEVAPDIDRHPELAEPLLFGPMLPPRYRVDGPGALDTAAETFAQQLRTSPRPALDPYDLEMYAKLRLQQQLGPAKT